MSEPHLNGILSIFNLALFHFLLFDLVQLEHSEGSFANDPDHACLHSETFDWFVKHSHLRILDVHKVVFDQNRIVQYVHACLLIENFKLGYLLEI